MTDDTRAKARDVMAQTNIGVYRDFTQEMPLNAGNANRVLAALDAAGLAVVEAERWERYRILAFELLKSCVKHDEWQYTGGAIVETEAVTAASLPDLSPEDREQLARDMCSAIYGDGECYSRLMTRRMVEVIAERWHITRRAGQ